MAPLMATDQLSLAVILRAFLRQEKLVMQDLKQLLTI